MLGLGASLAKGGASLLTYVKDNLKLYLDFTSNKSNTLKFPSEGSTYFSGSDQYIEIADNSNLDIAQGENLTFACWLKAEDSGANETLFSKLHHTGGGVDLGYEIFWHSSEKIQFFIKDTAGNDYYSYANQTLTYGKWYHYAVVWDSSTMKATHYIDGVNVGVDPENDGTIGDASNSGVARIGLHARTTSYDFKGNLANIGIWKRVLSQEEVQSIMNKSYSQLKGVEKTSLKAWWALDDTVNTEKITNGDFSSWTNDNPDGWTISTDLSGGVESNDVKITEDANGARIYSTGTNIHMTQNVMTIGATYEVTIVVHSVTTGDITTQNLSSNLSINSAGTHTVTTTATATGFRIKRNFPVDMVISSVSVKEVQSNDSKGSNNGTIIGATTTTSVYGGNAPILPRAVDVAKEGQADAIGNGSASFDGTSDYIDAGKGIGYSLGNNYAGSLTVSMWFKADGTWQEGLFDIGAFNGTDGEFHLRSWGNTLTWYLNGLSWKIDLTSFTSNDWNHIALVYTAGSEANSNMYLNGIAVGSKSGTFPLASDLDFSGLKTIIGARKEVSGTTVFDGQISQVGIWTGALTQAQIQSVMESTSYQNIPSSVKSTLGSELITNGTFDSDISGWGKSNISNTPDVTYNNGKARIAYSSSGNTINIGINTTNNPFNGISGTVKVTGNIQIISGSISSGSFFQVYETNTANNVSVTPDSNGDFTAYIKVGTNNQLGIYASADVCTFEVDNISAKLVSHDLVAYYPLDGSSSRGNGTDDATTGEVLGDELADTTTYTGGSNGSEFYIRNSNVPTLGGIYKLTFDVDSYSSGSFYFTTNTGSNPRVEPSVYSTTNSSIGSQNGSETYYLKINVGGGFKFKASGTYSANVSNISLKEITSNTGVLY